MGFTVSGSYGKRDLTALRRAVYVRNYTRRQRSVTRTARIAGGAVILAAAVIGFRMTFGESAAETTGLAALPTLLIGLAMGSYFLVRGLTDRSFFSEWMTWRSYRGKISEMRYVFGEEGFDETVNGNELHFAYDTIESVYEDGERFYLFVNRQSAHMLRKSDFTEGAPEAFRAFVVEKTGCTVQAVD